MITTIYFTNYLCLTTVDRGTLFKGGNVIKSKGNTKIIIFAIFLFFLKEFPIIGPFLRSLVCPYVAC